MEEQDWKKVRELFDTAERAGLSLFAFVTVPVAPAGKSESSDVLDADAAPGLLDESAEPVQAAHLVWAASPREARLMVSFPGGHFINEITGAAIVSFDSKDILAARDSYDIAMLDENLQAMLSQSALHD